MNTQAQADEVEALRAIYEGSFRTVNERHHLVCLNDGALSMELAVIFPDDYPTSSPPVYEIRSAPWINSTDLASIQRHFQTLYEDTAGEVVVYQWVEWLQELMSERTRALSSQEDFPRTDIPDSPDEPSADHESSVVETTLCPDILHGEPLTDRKSTFQAHLARVHSADEVKRVLAELKQSKKIATATHNIMAYRIHHSDRDVHQQDCDDDGEAAAGGRLLHLMQIMDIRNAVVVVTRWYGGVHLHADRFKHINNVARTLIQETGLGLEHREAADAKVKKPKTSSKAKTGKHR